MVAVTVEAVAVLAVVLIYQSYFPYQPICLNFFLCFLSIYMNVTFHISLRDHNKNKVTQLFCVISAITPYGEVFYHGRSFNELIYV